MSVYLSNKSLILGIILLATINTNAQKLKFLVPDAAIAQYAGSIGRASAGISYDLFKNKRGNLDLLYGYVPERKGGAFSTVTTKFNYRPFVIKAGKNFVIYPINPGAFISYTVNKDFDLTWDRGQYPKGYYYWSEALRFHLAFSSEVKIKTPTLFKNEQLKSVSVYYEINTNDVYLINYAQNKRYLDITGIFKAGIGIRASF
jgi:hypothetical protein